MEAIHGLMSQVIKDKLFNQVGCPFPVDSDKWMNLWEHILCRRSVFSRVVDNNNVMCMSTPSLKDTRCLQVSEIVLLNGHKDNLKQREEKWCIWCTAYSRHAVLASFLTCSYMDCVTTK